MMLQANAIMKTLYQEILTAKIKRQPLLAILLDPDKLSVATIVDLIDKINQSPATHLLVGGSSFDGNHLCELINVLKSNTNLPILLFPGNANQISPEANGILFLQLLSGRNPQYLIEQQIAAVPLLEKSQLEILSTGYLLVESGSETAVERVSHTKPLSRTQVDFAAQTAKAGEFIGNKLIYLEAGSGAQQAVPLAMISAVAERITIPLIVGGGIRSREAISAAYDAGADMVVIGTAFENDPTFFD